MGTLELSDINPTDIFNGYQVILRSDSKLMSKNQLELIKARLDSHEKWLSTEGKDGQRFQARNEDFRGVDFMHRDLSRAEFAMCNFYLSTFHDAKMKETRFFDCGFDKTLFTSAVFINATLSVTHLRYCNFYKSILNGCSIVPGQGLSVQLFTDAQVNDFSGCEMISCNISGLNLSETVFAKAKIGALNFSDCKIRSADFSQTEIINPLYFSNCNLAGANFRGAKLGATKFSRCALIRSDFSNIQASGLIFQGGDISYAIFNGAQMPKSTLGMVSAQGTIFQLSDINNTEMRLCNFRFADFRNCSMYGSDLSGSDLQAAKIDNTTNKNMVNFTACIWIDGRTCANESIGICH